MDYYDQQAEYGYGTITREIAGALASFWSGGDGPSHSAVDTAFELAGFDTSVIPLGNKEGRVRAALRLSEGYTETVRLVEELLDILRAQGEIESNPTKARRLQTAFARHGARLDDQGFLDWVSTETASFSTDSEAPPLQAPVPVTTPTPLPVQVPEPSRDLLSRLLRRIPSALRPLIDRRRERHGITLNDEYDLQDAVEAVLRLIYNDVRAEERSPSNGGSSSTIDFLIKQEDLAIEIKVTRPGRGEREIKKEIVVDIFDYEKHPAVDNLLVVIYDLAGTFKNGDGFEDDFSKEVNNLQVQTLVVGAPAKLGTTT